MSESTRPHTRGDLLHRGAEFVLACTLAVVTLPLLAAAAVASALAYRTSPFFVHERIGQHGRPFRFVKIRTLPPSTPHYADKFEIQRAPMPRSMQLLRKLHLDELPQLWFVVSGRMALVGPRPEMASLHQRIAPHAAGERLSVRPGITGLWQISVHCDGLICDRIEYDRLYVQHRNPLLDAWILFETARKMIFGTRIHLFEVPQWAVGEPTPATTQPVHVTPPATVGGWVPTTTIGHVAVEGQPSAHDGDGRREIQPTIA